MAATPLADSPQDDVLARGRAVAAAASRRTVTASVDETPPAPKKGAAKRAAAKQAAPTPEESTPARSPRRSAAKKPAAAPAEPVDEAPTPTRTRPSRRKPTATSAAADVQPVDAPAAAPEVDAVGEGDGPSLDEELGPDGVVDVEVEVDLEVEIDAKVSDSAEPEGEGDAEAGAAEPEAAEEESDDGGFVYRDDDEDDAPPQQVVTAGATADPVKDYLKQIGKVALLNAEQEVELAKRIEAGLFAEERLGSGQITEMKLRRELYWIGEDGKKAKNHLL